MSNQMEFSDIEHLNRLLKEKRLNEKRSNEKHGSQNADFEARQTGLKSQASEKKKRNQKGGDPTPLPWVNYNPTSTLNTASPNANNYGVTSPINEIQTTPMTHINQAWKTVQMGGKLPSLWGKHPPVDKIAYQHPVETYTRSDIVDAVADVTADHPDDINETINSVYGKNRQSFNDEDLDTITSIHMDSDESSQHGGSNQLSCKFQRNLATNVQSMTVESQKHDRSRQNQKGGDPTPMPWQWYNPAISEGSQTMNYNITAPEMPQLMFETSGPSGNSPNLMEVSTCAPQTGGGKKSKSKTAKTAPTAPTATTAKTAPTAPTATTATTATTAPTAPIANATKSKKLNQKGGEATPMPWEWYNPTIPEGSQTINYNIANPEMPQLIFPTSGPSGNSPNLIEMPLPSCASQRGGGRGSRRRNQRGGTDLIEESITEGKLLKDLGDATLVVTPQNLEKLFAYVYKKYPTLEKVAPNVLEDADMDDAFIWSEMQLNPISFVVNSSIPELTLNFYENTYRTGKNLDAVRNAFGRE